MSTEFKVKPFATLSTPIEVGDSVAVPGLFESFTENDFHTVEAVIWGRSESGIMLKIAGYERKFDIGWVKQHKINNETRKHKK